MAISGFRRIGVHPVFESRVLSVEDSLGEPLAEAYGCSIEPIESETDLHRVFSAQGEHLLRNIVPDLSESALPLALELVRKRRLHERTFWEESEFNAGSASAHVVVPYAPQDIFLQEREAGHSVPLRMTLALTRHLIDGRVGVARCNLWVAHGISPQAGAYRARKDISKRRIIKAEEVDNYLRSPQRSAKRAGVAIGRILGSQP